MNLATNSCTTTNNNVGFFYICCNKGRLSMAHTNQPNWLGPRETRFLSHPHFTNPTKVKGQKVWTIKYIIQWFKATLVYKILSVK